MEGEAHQRAIDHFIADFDSSFCHLTTSENIPFVAGASGHTSTLLRSIKLYDQLALAEYSEYALACFAFLTAGGNHSFHETMIIAKTFGVPYEINNYKNLLTELMHSQCEIQAIFQYIPDSILTKTPSNEAKPGTLNKIVYQNILSTISFIKALKPQLDAILPGQHNTRDLILKYS